MEASVGAGFVASVVWTEFHVVSQLGDALMGIVDIGSTVVSHDVGIPSGSCGWVVDGTTLVAEESAVVVLVNHSLILFINNTFRDGYWDLK